MRESDVQNYDKNPSLPLSLFLLDTRLKNEAFGSSLLLSNSPMSPKVVNGSFAAIYDGDEFLAKAYSGIRISVMLKYLALYRSAAL